LQKYESRKYYLPIWHEQLIFQESTGGVRKRNRCTQTVQAPKYSRLLWDKNSIGISGNLDYYGKFFSDFLSVIFSPGLLRSGISEGRDENSRRMSFRVTNSLRASADLERPSALTPEGYTASRYKGCK
jgi:hypothetical protein